jgi:hypothetical protein
MSSIYKDLQSNPKQPNCRWVDSDLVSVVWQLNLHQLIYTRLREQYSASLSHPKEASVSSRAACATQTILGVRHHDPSLQIGDVFPTTSILL